MLKLTTSERIELQHQAEADDGLSASARHAKLILLLADGLSWAAIRARLHCSDSYIARWSKRFGADRLAGLYSKHAGREPYKVTDRVESRVLRRTTRHTPADGSGQWSSRKLATELGGSISHTTVARIWAKHGITPQRNEREAVTPNLPFDARAADVIGLYLSPPLHAAVFSVDDADARAAAPATDETPCTTRHPRARAHEGVKALYAALKSRHTNTADAPPTSRQTSAEFAAFLVAITANQPADQEVHVIADNPATGKTRALTALLAEHPRVRMQFTATYAAWLDEVERNLAGMESGLSAPDEHKPASDLKRKLMRHIRRWSRLPRPIKWSHLENRLRQAGETPGTRNRQK
ncbi:MAG: IS630 family transposase [Rhodanobacter sp.]